MTVGVTSVDTERQSVRQGRKQWQYFLNSEYWLIDIHKGIN